jgi:Cu+-exporting ATPase
MWPFKKVFKGETLKLKISGMHCSTCALNIDNGIEDIEGVVSSKTNFAKGETEVVFRPGKSIRSATKQVIEKLGYRVI